MSVLFFSRLDFRAPGAGAETAAAAAAAAAYLTGGEDDATSFRSVDAGVEAAEVDDAVVKEARGAGDVPPGPVGEEEREVKADIAPERTAPTAVFSRLVVGGLALPPPN